MGVVCLEEVSALVPVKGMCTDGEVPLRESCPLIIRSVQLGVAFMWERFPLGCQGQVSA